MLQLKCAIEAISLLFQRNVSGPSLVIGRLMPIIIKKFKAKGDEKIMKEVRGHLTLWLVDAAHGDGDM